MICEREIKKGFPKFTRIEIFENDLGYYLKRKGVDEVLDISFKNAKEAIQHAIGQQWIIIAGKRCHIHDSNNEKFVTTFMGIINFQLVSDKATSLTRLLHKSPSMVFRRYRAIKVVN